MVGRTQIRRASGQYFVGHVLNCTQDPVQNGVNGARNVHLDLTQDCSTNPTSRQTGTAQACVSDPNEFSWFASGRAACAWQTNIFPWDQMRPISGPNLPCPTAMLGLSGDRGQIVRKLDHMYPAPGGTQADIGLMWGLRMLSPRDEWRSFWGYAADRRPKPFNDNTVRKVLILLTDGENVAPHHFEGYYGCNETNDRGDAGPCWKASGISRLDRTALDNLTLDACQSLRTTYGVEVYTILVDVPDAAAQSLMKQCTGDPKRSFNITSSELDMTFQAIARSRIRLTQ